MDSSEWFRCYILFITALDLWKFIAQTVFGLLSSLLFVFSSQFLQHILDIQMWISVSYVYILCFIIPEHFTDLRMESRNPEPDCSWFFFYTQGKTFLPKSLLPPAIHTTFWLQRILYTHTNTTWTKKWPERGNVTVCCFTRHQVHASCTGKCKNNSVCCILVAYPL